MAVDLKDSCQVYVRAYYSVIQMTTRGPQQIKTRRVFYINMTEHSSSLSFLWKSCEIDPSLVYSFACVCELDAHLILPPAINILTMAQTIIL